MAKQTVVAYLAAHFQSGPEFAATCKLPLSVINELVAQGLAAKPSYVVAGEVVSSAVFGSLPAPNAIDGEYFHPRMANWYQRARQVGDVLVMRSEFVSTMTTSLRNLHETEWPLDCFDSDGGANEPALASRLNLYWNHFLAGTFGLCVADPTDTDCIANKEVLQEKLGALTENGQRREYSSADEHILDVMDRYAAAAMPFSPAEYSRSSRKRLVDDLRPLLLAALGRAPI